jgi:hypothetical protein
MSGWITPYTEEQIAELAKTHRSGKFLLRIDAATPILICTGDNEIIHDAETYSPRDFDHSGIDSSGRLSVTINNVDNAISEAKFTEGSFGGLEVLLVWYLVKDDGTYLEVGERVFSGRNCSWDVSELELNLKEETEVRRKSALQVVSAHCDLPFKGTLCTYAGGDTRCLKTYDDCLSKPNQTKFRGFRHAQHAGFRLNLDGYRYIYLGQSAASNSTTPNPAQTRDATSSGRPAVSREAGTGAASRNSAGRRGY